MLYYFYAFADIHEWLHPLNLLQYVTFRAAAAALTAFAVAVLLGPRIIRRLRQKKITDRPVKNDSRQLDALHQAKASTPTMGGLIIVGGTLLAIIFWAAWPGALIYSPGEKILSARGLAERTGGYYAVLGTLLLLATAVLGFVDDRIKLKGRKGLRLWTKLAFQVLIASAAASTLYFFIDGVQVDRLAIPFMRYDKTAICLGAWFLSFAILVMVGSCNAVNLADGLDGLAGGCSAIVAITYATLCYVASNAKWCSYLFVPFVQGSGELAVCAAALGGACLGFLWFNCHPAEVFMGDTGSLPIGAFIGYTALVVKHELLLVLVGGVFVAEALSVLIQIASFRLFGKRVFRIAPLHHHFEFMGWPENKVVVRLWMVGLMLAAAGIATLKIR